MEKSEPIKKHDGYIKKDMYSMSDSQCFEKRCGCKNARSIVTKKYIIDKISADSTNSCDDCGGEISYHALPHFKCTCNICHKTRILCTNEDTVKELSSRSHKDERGNDCEGKMSYSVLQNFEFTCNLCHKTRILYVTENGARNISNGPHKDEHYNSCYGKISYNKLNAEFVMSTCWNYHWDKIELFDQTLKKEKRPHKDKKQTHYTLGSFKDNTLYTALDLLDKKLDRKDWIRTIFLKKETYVIKGKPLIIPVADIAWIGYVYDFDKTINFYDKDTEKDKERIHFTVNVEQKIFVPPRYAHQKDVCCRYKNNV